METTLGKLSWSDASYAVFQMRSRRNSLRECLPRRLNGNCQVNNVPLWLLIDNVLLTVSVALY